MKEGESCCSWVLQNLMIPFDLQMVKNKLLSVSTFCLMVGLIGGEFTPHHAHSAFLYKSYIVRQDRGQDILCDPYIVKKDDYVLKLFRQKGEISHQDFPKFLEIFKRINPHIRDINTIRPNQRIFIPLKNLKPGTLPGQSSGIVTIPFVTIKKIDELLSSYSTEYKVQKGDCVSVLIARQYGKYGTKSYQEGIKLFRLFNPHISDLNLIYHDQSLYIPDPSIRNQAFYRSLLDGSASVNPETDQQEFSHTSQPDAVASSEPLTPPPDPSDLEGSPFQQAAAALNAKLMSKGVYYFPRDGSEDFELDLSKFPVMDFNNKTFVFSSESDTLSEPEIRVMKSHWSNMELVQISKDPSAEELLDSVLNPNQGASDERLFSFSDHGVEVEIRAKWSIQNSLENIETPGRRFILPIDDWDEHTPISIRNYLEHHNIIVRNILGKVDLTKRDEKPETSEYSSQDILVISFSNRKTYVKNFVSAIGCNYAENVSVMFPYAGIQVRAASNLISTQEGKEVLVDFGDLYGDAIQSIEKTGFRIIQVLEKDDSNSIMAKLMNAVGISYTVRPSFIAAKRQGIYHIRLTIPGFLIEDVKKSKLLLTAVPLHDRIVQFLQEQGIRIIRIESMEKLG